MNFAFLSLVALAASPFLGMTTAHEAGCSHGILYVSDANSQTVYGYGLDSGLSNLTKIATIEGLQGDGPLLLDATHSGLYLVATYWGAEALDYQDGVVNFINTGSEVHGDHMHTGEPSVIPQAELDCGPVWHLGEHAGYIILYCDGSVVDQVNSTFYVMDESLLAGEGSPYLQNFTLAGSHHGIAMPLSSSRLLHSLPTVERMNWNANASSLAEHFQVVDMEGNVVETLTDSSDPTSHCTEYHGGSTVDNVMYMCCEDKVLVLEIDPDTSEITRRTLDFPSTISDQHRCGYIHTTSNSEFVVADYADWYAEIYAPQLIAFPKDATDLSDADVLVVEGENGHCEYEFERSEGKYVVVLQENGLVEFYSYARPDGWKLEASTTLDGVTGCDATLALGYMQAFVAVSSGKIVYAIDMDHISHGEGVTVSSLALDYSPNSITVAGVPPSLACGPENHDHEDEGTEEEDAENADSASFLKSVVAPFFAMAVVVGIMG